MVSQANRQEPTDKGYHTGIGAEAVYRFAEASFV